ncbi:27414_t:CDS:2 [Dentiscutata erythropus]|uniref:27414_t:CDS:1 n=1 Tax=Dentiscutata erythropus TaxID=1348616 RepID=A0A9N9DSI9_9GLOM|nr:27414_t:CDS:2 [Dentiscutata erythropus]
MSKFLSPSNFFNFFRQQTSLQMILILPSTKIQRHVDVAASKKRDVPISSPQMFFQSVDVAASKKQDVLINSPRILKKTS